MDKVSPFLSTQVSSLLTTDPQRRPTAEELLRRIHDEPKKVRGRSKSQNLTIEEKEDDDEKGEEDDETRGSDNDSDYETFGNSHKRENSPSASPSSVVRKQNNDILKLPFI